MLARLLEAGWNITYLDKRCVTLNHGSGVRIKCRHRVGWDLGVLVEIFLSKVYESPIEGKVVPNGDSAIYFARRGASKVIGLEPFPESFELAVENIRLNNLEGVTIPLTWPSHQGRAVRSCSYPPTIQTRTLWSRVGLWHQKFHSAQESMPGQSQSVSYQQTFIAW
jgi:hypothetical protein